MRTLVLLLFAALAIGGTASAQDTSRQQRRAAQTYYVSSAGSDSNDGATPETAWKTLSKVNSWRFVPGDTVRFHGGHTFSGSLTNASLSGSPAAAVTINSYEDGSAVIDGGTQNGIYLVNPEFLTIEDLAVEGSGWNGAGAAIVPVNGGKGIWIQVTRTAGHHLRNITIRRCVVSGFYIGVYLDTTLPNSVGFENANISGNNFSNNLTMGFNLQGYNPYIQGPVDQSRGIYVGYNIIQNIPGDPYSGAGGIHGTFKTEAGGMQVANTTGTTIEWNYVADVAGYGGLYTGLVNGGSAAVIVTNSRGFRMSHNEVARTGCIKHYDGSALDADQDAQDGEIDGNLTYDNVGPAIQIGSFGGKVTANIRVHHNISYNDVRGNNAGGISEQGAIRLWGNTENLQIFHNTIYVGAEGARGIPSAVNFEQLPVKPGDLGANAQVEFVNNIFKTTDGVPIFWANQTTNKAHLGVASALGNVYDASGGKLLIANEDGSKLVDIDSLASWRSLGFEALDGVMYGIAADAGLRNITGFEPPSSGFTTSGKGISSITNFDLKPGSASIGAGMDPWLAKIYIDLGTAGFHGVPASAGARIDAGACPFGVPLIDPYLTRPIGAERPNDAAPSRPVH